MDSRFLSLLFSSEKMDLRSLAFSRKLHVSKIQEPRMVAELEHLIKEFVELLEVAQALFLRRGNVRSAHHRRRDGATVGEVY